MKKYIYVTIAACAVLLFSLQSCKKDLNSQKVNSSSTENGIVNGRLYFKDMSEAIEKIDQLSNMDSSQFAQWESNLQFKSYYSLTNEIIQENWKMVLKGDTTTPGLEYNNYISYGMKRILNKDTEVQIGDDIMFFNGNKVIYFNINDQTKELAKQKINFDPQMTSGQEKFNVQEVKIDTIHPPTNSKLKNWGDARYQSIQWGGSHWFKMIFELYEIDTPLQCGYWYKRWEIHNKLEYKNGNTWRAAGEATYKSINVQASIYNSGYLTWYPAQNRVVGGGLSSGPLSLGQNGYALTRELCNNRSWVYPYLIDGIRIEGTISQTLSLPGYDPIDYSETSGGNRPYLWNIQLVP